MRILCLLFMLSFVGCSSLNKADSSSYADGLSRQSDLDFYFLKAQLSSFKGELREARKILKEVTASEALKTKDKVPFYRFLAKVELELDRPQEARKLYSILEVSPFLSEEGRAELAFFNYKEGNFAKALGLYQELARTAKEKTNYWIYSGLISSELNRYKDAESYFKEITKKGKDSSYFGYFYLARLAAEQGKQKKSYSFFKKCLELKNNFEPCALEWAHLSSAWGDQKQAANILEKHQKKNPDSLKSLSLLLNWSFKKRDFKKVRHYLERMERVDPNNFTVKKRLALLLAAEQEYDLALQRYDVLLLSPEVKEEDFVNALNLKFLKDGASQALSYGKKIAQHSVLTERFFIKLKSIELQAKESDGKAMLCADLENNGHFCYFAEAAVNQNLGLLKKAQSLFKKAFKIQKNFYKAEYNYAKSFLKESPKRSLRFMEKLVRKAPGYAPALNFMSYYWLSRGVEQEKTEEYILQALTSEPENPNYLDTYGLLLVSQKKYEAAVSAFKKALSKLKDQPEVYEHIADALVKMNRIKEALAYYQLAYPLLTGDNLSRVGGKIANIQKPNQIKRSISSTPFDIHAN